MTVNVGDGELRAGVWEWRSPEIVEASRKLRCHAAESSRKTSRMGRSISS